MASSRLLRRCRLRRGFSALPGGRSYDGLWANTAFEPLGVHPSLVRCLAAQDILRPTVVQADAFNPIVRGRDVILRSETGSGKTLAYLLPLVNRIYHLHDRAKQAAIEDPDAPNPLQRSRPWVVLTPTSDLAAQVLSMLEAIDGNRLVNAQSLTRLFRWEATRPIGLQSQAGSFQEPRLKERTTLPSKPGQSKPERGAAPQYASLSPQIRWGSTDIVVTTPLKFCEELEHYKDDGLYPACVVMDEADALFQGLSRLYLFDIFRILRPRPPMRHAEERRPLPEMIPTQFIFAAATYVHVGPFSEGNMLFERFCTAHVVETKHFHRLPAGVKAEHVRWLAGSDDWHQRVDQLLEVLRQTPCRRTLIFVNSLHNGHVLLQFFKANDWPVVSFMKGPHGRMGPRFRDAQKFADGEANIMIATEFGGRGIDWPEVDHVVNFQMPTGAVCWLHRAGRTGRMGKRGLVTNFVGAKDQTLAQLIQAEVDAGKDLHELFSRKRSLRKRLRAAAGEGGDVGDGEGPDDQGPIRLDGGLELTGAAASASEAEGELLGYLTTPKLKSGPVKDTTNKESVQAETGLEGIRERLLASDSESEDEGASDSDSDTEPSGNTQEAQAPPGPFSWSQLAEDGAGEAALGPAPSRQLQRASGGRAVQAPKTRFTDRDRLPGEGPKPGLGRRKPLGVRMKNRLDAGRNYAAPDDDLLL